MRMIPTVVGVILKIILGAIALCVLAYVLLIGGCVSLGALQAVSEGIQDSAADAAVQQAAHAPLPPHVRRLVDFEFQGWSSMRDPRLGRIVSTDDAFWPPQDPGARYLLTSEGLIDFATGSLIALDCPGLSPVTDRVIDFRKRWLDDQLFLWGRCVFDVTTLQSGAIEELWCGAGHSGCTHAELLAAMAEIIPEADRAYANGTEYLLVKLSAGDPVHLWIEHNLYPHDTALIEQAGLKPIQVPTEAGRAIPPTHRLSPNGEYAATVDGTSLTVKRVQDGLPVVQVRAEDFHHAFATASHQWMGSLGWTNDSRQIIFLVGTSFNVRRSLAQVFTLTVP
jgi:hypothetical protein